MLAAWKVDALHGGHPMLAAWKVDALHGGHPMLAAWKVDALHGGHPSRVPLRDADHRMHRRIMA